MRISTSTMTNLTMNSMGSAYNKYAAIINKIAANKNFLKISDNVPDATRVLKLNDQLSKLNNYQSNIQTAINEMDFAYDTLGDVNEEISNINSLIVQASNATTDPQSAIAIADEIKERVATITDKMNQKYLDSYVFSGTYTGTVPYQTTIDTANDDLEYFDYKGSSKAVGERKLTISEDTTFTYNLTGEEIFGAAGDTNNFFYQMAELDKLLRDPNGLDYAAIRQKISSAKDASANVTQMQGNISAKVTKLEATKEINQSTITNLTGQKAELEEVDISKAASELSSAYTSLQASYMVGTRILQSVSLLDYL